MYLVTIDNSAHHKNVCTVTAVEESQGSLAWVPLAAAGACLASTLEVDHQESLEEACLDASAQQPFGCCSSVAMRYARSRVMQAVGPIYNITSLMFLEQQNLPVSHKIIAS